MSTNDGGPAFPAHPTHWPNGEVDRSDGMTLRDYFAAAALQGLCANSAVIGYNSQCGWGPVNCEMRDIIATAYESADLMLERRTEDN